MTSIIAAGALLAASATSAPDNGMRCLLVAHGFTAVGKTDAEKRVAALTEAF